MDLSQLKTQVMTMFMMRSASKPGESGSQDIFMILYSMMMINLIEWLFRQIPLATEYAKQYITKKYGDKTKNVWQPLIDKHNNEKQIINSITMIRTYKDGEKPADRIDNIIVEKIDAVLDYICNLDNARHVRMDVRFSLNSGEEIDLTPLLKAKIKQNGSGNESETEILLYSTSWKISEIRAWVDEIYANYIAEKNNKLGNKIFYFNELVHEPAVITDMSDSNGPKKTYRWDTIPKMLSFNMNEFKTSKSFVNVYGHHVDELKERLDLFVKHPEWYMDRGIPYSLGIMLYGIPGSGKTSTIKAIAKDTNRHIFNLSLRPYTTQRQLTNLFFNETVHVQTYDGGKQTLKIPLNKRVYVIEDIDCLTDVVLDRSLTKEPLAANKEGEALTLSFLLNLLDGVLETPGRILVITSNYPDKLDKAFIRPGRIDVRIEFKHADREFILDMINKFYNSNVTIDAIPLELNSIFTPAEVMESMCNHFKSPTGALDHLLKKLVAKKEKEIEMASGTRLEDLGLTMEYAMVDGVSNGVRPDTPIPLEDIIPPSLLVNELELIDTRAESTSTETKPTETASLSKNIINCNMCDYWYDASNQVACEEHKFAICARNPPKHIEAPKEFSQSETVHTYNSHGLTWKCNYDHIESQFKHCKICKPKRAEADKRQIIEMEKIQQQQMNLFGVQEDSWGNAVFQDAIIPEGAGGWMPGQVRDGEERSVVDLNQINGR
jgi:hypothetical protein